jgi:type IV pilus assembly protein PilC
VPEYSYEALTEAGSVEHGEMDAESETELESALRSQGQFLIRASPREAKPGARQGDRKRRITDGSVPRKELLAFTEYLWGSAQAGIPILTTLEDVELQLESKRLRRIVAQMREAMVEDGKSLSESMAEHPKAFPALYVGTVQAGETTGQLDYVLGQLVDYLQWQQEINVQIRQATLYPIIVITVMLGLVALLLLYVYPRLEPIFTGYAIELPVPTRAVLATGDFLQTRGLMLVGGIVGVIAGWFLIGRTRRGRYAIDTIKLRMPIFGRLIHELEMARVVTYMGLFYRTGIDLLRGLSLTEQIVGNVRVVEAIGRARVAISGGDSIAHAFAETRLFPAVVVRSFAMGEATGKLDESLERARVYYAREVPAAVRRMLAALQPLLIIVIGAVIATIALSIFLPIMRIYEAVSP